MTELVGWLSGLWCPSTDRSSVLANFTFICLMQSKGIPNTMKEMATNTFL